MPNRKIKIEFRDDEGSKYTISLEGKPSKDKVNKIMSVIEELDTSTSNIGIFNLDTTFNKTLKLIEDKYPLGSFTSNDVLEAFEDEYNNPIKLSTVSTYLTRLLEKGHLKRERIGNTWVYKKLKIHLQQ
ncbi:MAG TPA: BlaI/MecI/CopY family transcriptional regulator [Thermodesulfobacteriota bacterium]|nr:BlaI/MecI/CopY family transcriptional regulator [Thermodesulfobacteriota bacterium]